MWRSGYIILTYVYVLSAPWYTYIRTCACTSIITYVFGYTSAQLEQETGISTFLRMEVSHRPHRITRRSQPLIAPPSEHATTSTSTCNRKSFSATVLILMSLDWGFPHPRPVPLPSDDAQGSWLRLLNPRERKRQSLSIRLSPSFRRPVSPSTLLEDHWRNSWTGNTESSYTVLGEESIECLPII